jgi:hypothetical protein
MRPSIFTHWYEAELINSTGHLKPDTAKKIIAFHNGFAIAVMALATDQNIII